MQSWLPQPRQRGQQLDAVSQQWSQFIEDTVEPVTSDRVKFHVDDAPLLARTHSADRAFCCTALRSLEFA